MRAGPIFGEKVLNAELDTLRTETTVLTSKSVEGGSVSVIAGKVLSAVVVILRELRQYVHIIIKTERRSDIQRRECNCRGVQLGGDDLPISGCHVC